MKHNNSKKVKKPWPTKAVMEQIYEMKLWGDNASRYYSGFGSHNLLLVTPYVNAVISFLASFKTPLSVSDLGCGDFNIGKELVTYAQKYIAIDIVENLITYNKKRFKSPYLEFHCLDIAKDELPKTDCVLIRQVLQHLSNEEVQKIVSKLTNFKYVILTEHIPHGDFIPNKDIISGQGIRLKKQSGIDVLAPPFNLKIKNKKQLLSISLENSKGVIETILYEMF